jgi:O-antigen ligase
MSAMASTLTGLGYRFQDFSARLAGSRWLRHGALFAFLLAMGAFWGALVALAGTAGVLLFVAVFACIFILRDFRVGVVLLVLIMPISQSYAFPHAMFGVTGLNPLNMLLATTLGVYFMRALGSGSVRHFVPRPLFLLYLLPLVAGGLMGMEHVGEIPAIFKATDMIFFDNKVGYIRDMLVKPLTFVLYALLVAAAVWRSKAPERFVTPVLFSVWTMAALVVGFILSLGVGISDLAGTYARHVFTPLGLHANDLGRLYVIAYALLLFIWDRTDNLTLKLVLFLSMGLVVASLILTFSRGAFLGFVIVNLIYLLSRRKAKTMLLALAVIPVFLYFLPGAVWSRLQAGKGEGANAVSAGRIDEIWAPLMPELFDNPLFGNGLGSVMYSNAMRQELLPTVAHPHNAFLEAYLDLGAAGLVVLLAFWVHAWLRFRALAKDERVHRNLQGLFEGAAAGLASFLAAGFAGSSLMPSPEQAFLWLAVGMMYGMGLRLKYGAKES